MPVGEREVRSKLAQLIGDRGIVRGTLVVREKVCGKSNCKCARGERHIAKYLVMSEGGQKRQLYVSDEMEDKVKRWLANYREAQESLEEICNINWARLANREG
jgi:hypothetical protein